MAKADLEKLQRWADDARTILAEGAWDAEDNAGLAVLEIEALRKVAKAALVILNTPGAVDGPNAHPKIAVGLLKAYEAYEDLLKRPTPKEDRDAEDALAAAG